MHRRNREPFRPSQKRRAGTAKLSLEVENTQMPWEAGVIIFTKMSSVVRSSTLFTEHWGVDTSRECQTETRIIHVGQD
jgi:hypothetical protein